MTEPALPAREWGKPHHFIQCYDSWDGGVHDGVAEITAGADYLQLTSHQNSHCGDFSAAKDRHALAALCLYGQPFGFTQADVDAITRCLEADVWITVHQYEEAKPLESIRERIAALLPPVP